MDSVVKVKIRTFPKLSEIDFSNSFDNQVWDYILPGAATARNLNLASVIRCRQDADIGRPITARLSVCVKPLLKFWVNTVGLKLENCLTLWFDYASDLDFPTVTVERLERTNKG